MAKRRPSEDEIEDQISAADTTMDTGSVYPGMTYEQGVSDALGWGIGEEDDPPMSEGE